MKIKIEHDIPIDEFHYGYIISQIKTMKVGDSFLFDISKRGYIGSIFRRAGMKCQSRKVNDTEVRVWRVK